MESKMQTSAQLQIENIRLSVLIHKKITGRIITYSC
jgi:hypothetical protein